MDTKKLMVLRPEPATVPKMKTFVPGQRWAFSCRYMRTALPESVASGRIIKGNEK
ncbi:hypothetical protein MWU63_07870 [Pseudohalocynthiibacter sp. F2068]|jgi:hypothetical protein|nr:hypothetical protein [Pseudohalocynthiibacter sp. F2068]